MLQLFNVTKSFGSTTVLDSITWDLKPQTIYGLVGKNGVGKSTLLRCIAGVYPIDSGSIIYDETNAIDNPNIKKKIIFVSDEPFVIGQNTLKEMVEYYELFYPHFNHTTYNHLVSLFEFDENVVLENLSKGVKRQSSIIIALSLNPELLLLDESFDGLDPLVRNKLTHYLQQQENLTVVISSHNILDLEELCDEIVVLKGTQLLSKESASIALNDLIKVQVGFNFDVMKEQLSQFNPISHKVEGRVHTLVLKKSFEEFKHDIQFLHPALLYQMDLNLRELFIIQMEAQNHE